MGRAFRKKEKGAGRHLAAGAPEDMPGPGAPVEERRAWLLKERGPGVFAPEVLEEMRERMCAMPECERFAAARSLFCGGHQATALGEAGERELRALNREMERLARVSEKEAKQQAVRKFRSRVEQGDFAILFSGKLEELMRQAGKDAELNMELGALRVALARAIQEIEDPEAMTLAMTLAIARIASASARTARAGLAVRKARGDGS